MGLERKRKSGGGEKYRSGFMLVCIALRAVLRRDDSVLREPLVSLGSEVNR